MTTGRGGDRPRFVCVEARRPHALLAAAVATFALVAAPAAQPRRGRPAPAPTSPAPAPAKPTPAEPPAADDTAPRPAGGKPPPVFDFTGLDLAGRLRTPQLLYFLDRASEELERASLERRSFIPALVRSVDESGL